MRRPRPLSAVLLTLLAASCASTRMSALRNPEWPGRPVRRILVFLATDDIEARKTFEPSFNDYVTIASVVFIPAIDLLFPGRTFTPDQFAAKLKERDIDAVLLVNQGSSGISTAQLPTQATTGCALWSSTQGCVQTTTQITGGGTVKKPWAQYSLSLVDPADGKIIWVASANAGGNAFANWDHLRESLAKRTVLQLFVDGVIQ